PPPGDATISTGTTEAETLDLSDNYEIETRNDASGNALIRALTGAGQATGTFTGAAGTYDIDVTYFDESDGVATYQVLVNGVAVETWQGTGGTSGLGSAATRSFNVALDTGDTITIAGTKGGGELARIDKIEITPAGSGGGQNSPPVNANDIPDQSTDAGQAFNYTIPTNTFTDPDGDALTLSVTLSNGAALPGWLSFNSATNTFSGTPANGDAGTVSIRVTASDGEATATDVFTLTVDPTSGGGGNLPGVGTGRTEAEDLDLSVYVLESRNDASGGEAVRILTGQTGTASGTFTGTDGTYSVDVGYFNENDGVANWSIQVNGNTVASWNGQGGSGGAGTAAERSFNLALDTGDTITIQGTPGNNELARIDYIDIGGGSTGGGGGNLPALTVGTNEAEDLDLDGYEVENRGAASGGQLVRTLSSGTVAGEFQGADGTYQVTINYFDESDGVATYTLKVNGQTQSTFSGTGGQSAGGDPASNTVTLALSDGDEITIEGMRGAEELGRIDSISISSGGGGGPSGSTLSFAGDSTAYTVDLAAGRYAEAARILLLGDSLTEGAATDGGYRAPLYESITEDLGLWVDFVGSRTTNPESGLGDSNHQGTGGITAATIRGQINSIVNGNPNDFVLLMLGTNDALQTNNPQNTVAGNLLSIMQALEAANPNVKILLGKLPVTSRPEASGEIDAINATFPGLINQANNQGINVTLVSFDNISTNDYYDQLHPDAQGVEKFADNWLGGLTAVANEVNGTFDGTGINIANAVTNITGGSNHDRLMGDGNANVLNGSGGNDWLDGRGGNDTLTGGSGTDTFAFDAGQNGNNTITDYAGGETIRLIGFGFGNTNQAGNAFSQSGNNVVFNRSGVQITIENANVNQVRNNVEIGNAPQFSPTLDQGSDSFAFDGFTETMIREPLDLIDQAPAPTALDRAEPALTVLSEEEYADLFNEIDPDSGLHY
ncbi:MAG: putative Ig domain-containing protein, partial [Pseudomonadota bacterium]